MMHWMRKHMRAIMIGICIIIIPTFVYWGGSAGKARRAAMNQRSKSPDVAPVAVVNGTPITMSEFQQRLRGEAERRSRRGETPTFEEMSKDGTAERVLDGLIDSTLLNMEIGKSAFAVDNKFIIEKLRKEPAFQDDKGNFSPEQWNSWVAMDPKRNWNPIYAEIANQIAREVMLRRIMAPARVTETELKKEFENNYTKLQVKYVAIDPKIAPTPEQVQAQYDKDPNKYAIPEKKDVEFIAVSMQPARPALIDELLQRAKNNEDFAELAKANSEAPNASAGGDLGWLEPNSTPPFEAPLFALAVGAVSDVIQNGSDYYIFKIDEEKTNESTGARNVKARQILLRAKLEDADKETREKKAAELAEKAKSGDLSAVATEAGLTVQTAKGVSSDSPTTENVAPEDHFSFVKGLDAVEKGAVSEVIKARANLYIAKVLEVAPPVVQPLDAVRERVTKDAIETIRQSPEHAAEVKKLADDIAAKGKTLAEVVEKSPDLGLEIKESKEFMKKDFIAGDLMLQTVEIFDAVGSKEPGAFAGPLRGFRGEQYFIELVKKTPPTDENWKTDWAKEEPNIRRNAVAAKQSKLIQDYLVDLRERVNAKVPIQRDYEAIAKVLGMDKEKDSAEEPAADQKQEPAPPVTTSEKPADSTPKASE